MGWLNSEGPRAPGLRWIARREKMTDSFRKDMIVKDVVAVHNGANQVLLRLGIDPNDTCTLSRAASGNIPWRTCERMFVFRMK